MAAPWSENADRVVIEFKRSSAGTAGRVIELSHAPGVLPPQLAARAFPPGAWASLLDDAYSLAASHPYVGRPGAGQVAGWAGCFCLAAVVGFASVNPDAGDWPAWLAAAEAAVARHAPAFSAHGVALSLARAQGSYWIQADCAPLAAGGGGGWVVGGVPVAPPPPPPPGKPAY